MKTINKNWKLNQLVASTLVGAMVLSTATPVAYARDGSPITSSVIATINKILGKSTTQEQTPEPTIEIPVTQPTWEQSALFDFTTPTLWENTAAAPTTMQEISLVSIEYPDQTAYVPADSDYVTFSSDVASNQFTLCGYHFEYFEADGTTAKNFTYKYHNFESSNGMRDQTQEVYGNYEKNIYIETAANTVLKITAVNKSGPNPAQLAIYSGSVIEIEDLNIAATGPSGLATAGISIASTGTTLRLTGENTVYASGSYALNIGGETTNGVTTASTLIIDGEGTLNCISASTNQSYPGIRLAYNGSGITLNSGTLNVQGPIAISRGTKMEGNKITVNGGFLNAVGTTSIALGVADGYIALNGGQTTLDSANSHDIYGTLTTSSGSGSGVLIHKNGLNNTDLSKLNLLVMDLSANQTDPYNTLYNSTTTVENDGVYFGRVYGNVVLKQDFTIQSGWLVDLPSNATLRHRESDVDGTITSVADDSTYLTIQGLATVEGQDEELRGELRFQGIPYSAETSKDKIPFLWSAEDVFPNGTGYLSLILSDGMIGGTSSMGITNGQLYFSTNYTAILQNSTTEYNGGPIGMQFISEAGFADPMNRSAITERTFWSQSALSVQYVGLTAGSLTSSTVAPVDTYHTILQSLGSRIIVNNGDTSKYLFISEKAALTGEYTGLSFKALETGVSTFTVTPYDFSKDDRGTNGALIMDVADGVTYTLTSGGSLDLTDFNSTNIQLYCTELINPAYYSSVSSYSKYIKTLLEMGTDYELTYEITDAFSTDTNKGKIKLIANGIGNFTGKFTHETEIEVTQTFGSLGGEDVVLNWSGTGAVYIKPDGTIDLDTMTIKTVNGVQLYPSANYSYAAEVIQTGDSATRFTITVQNDQDENDSTAFEITASHAGTGSTYDQGYINLVTPINSRPDSLLYPDDLYLTHGGTTLVRGTDYHIYYQNTDHDYVLWTKGLDISFVDHDSDSDVHVKVTKTDGSEPIEFVALWQAGGTEPGLSFNEGILTQYDKEDAHCLEIYVAETYGVVLSIENLGLEAFTYDVEDNVDNDPDFVGSYIEKYYALGDTDVEMVTTFEGFYSYISALQQGVSTGTTQIISNIGTSETYTKTQDDDSKTWYLTLYGAGRYSGETTFEVPDCCVHFVDINQGVLGIIDNYMIVDPNPVEIYQTPDGGLHAQDLLVLEQRLPALDSNKDPDKQTLSTNVYEISTEAIKSTTQNHSNSDYKGKISFPLYIYSADTGEQLKYASTGVTVIPELYAEPAGTGSNFRNGALDLVESQVVDYIPPSGDEGEYTQGDLDTIFKSIRLYKNGTLLTYGVDYSLSLFDSFQGIGKYTYAVSATDITPTRDLSVVSSDLNTVAFDLEIEMVRKNEYTLTYDLNGGDGTAPEQQFTTSETEYVTFPANPTRVGYNFQGWGTSSTATTAVNSTILVKDITTKKVEDYVYSGTLYAIWEEMSPNTVYFDMNFDGQGIYASVPKKDLSETIDFPSDPARTGYNFTGWYTLSSDTQVYTPVSSTATYNSLTYETVGTVTDIAFIYAVWSEISYTVNFDPNGGTSPNLTSQTGLSWTSPIYLPNSMTTVREDYTFLGWATPSGSYAYNGQPYAMLGVSDQTTEIMLTAQWEANETSGGTNGNTGGTGGGSLSGGSSSSDSSTELIPDGDRVVVKVEGTTAHNDKTVQVTLDPTVRDEAIDLAETSGGNFDFVIVPTDTGINNNYYLELNRDDLDTLLSSSLHSLTLIANDVILTFDRNAIKHIGDNTVEYVTLSVENPTLTEDASALFGTRPFFSIGIIADDETVITSLSNGSAMITIPYSAPSNEAHGQILGGRLREIALESRTIIPTTGYDYLVDYQHKSLYEGEYLRCLLNETGVYGVVYRDLSSTLEDVSTHWAQSYLQFTDARRVYEVMTLVEADAKITRGIYVSVLALLEQADISAYVGRSSFVDVDAHSSYGPYIEWAFRNGIVTGMGEGVFDPDAEITREQMAVMLQQYIKTISADLPAISTNSQYTDNENIQDWASGAVHYVQSIGLMQGYLDGSFGPQDFTSYGEHAVAIQNLVDQLLSLTTVNIG